MIPGQRWEDLGVPFKRQRAKGFLTAPPRRVAGSQSARMADECPTQLAWCKQNLTLGEPTTRFLAYRICGALGLPHGCIDQAEDIVVQLRRLRPERGGIAMGAVRDARSTSVRPWIADPRTAAGQLLGRLQRLRNHRQYGQPYRVEVVAEADGSV